MDTVITWLGHACFKVRYRDFVVLFDPYAPKSVFGLSELHETCNLVLSSHQHSDHATQEFITIVPKEHNPFEIHRIDTYHDDAMGAKRGGNRIHILKSDDIRLAHFGDLGCSLTTSQLAALQGLDVAMIPVGGFYTIDASQAKAIIDAIQPRIVIPMHFRGKGFGYDVLDTVERYSALCDDVVKHDSNTMIVTRDTPKQTALLHLE